MNKPEDSLVLVAGLPRSGSTLLLNILGQNPQYHVGSTSGLLDQLVATRDQWQDNIWFRSEGLDRVKPRIRRMLYYMLLGYYEYEFASNMTVFDKNRSWLGYVGLIEYILKRRVKILVTLRPVMHILASMERLHRKDVLTLKRPQDAGLYLKEQTLEGRVENWLSPGGVVGLPISRLREAIALNYKDRMHFVRYDSLVDSPEETMQSVDEFLGFNPYSYGFNQIEQITKEDDSVHGMDLHTIRPKLERRGYRIEFPKSIVGPVNSSYVDLDGL